MTALLLGVALVLFVRGSAGGRLFGAVLLLLTAAWWLWLGRAPEPRVANTTPSPDETLSLSSSVRRIKRRVELTCAGCGEKTTGSIEQAGAFTCRRCGVTLDLWALGDDRQIHRPMWFLQGYTPPEAEEWTEHRTAQDDLLYIWFLVATRVRYERDSKVYCGDADVWQRGETTWRMRSGDCEDKSILLADWLGRRGHDARVVLGKFRGEGHAWVLLRDAGRDYLLEATHEYVSRRLPPLASVMGAEYAPEHQFDRRTLWVESRPIRTTDYRAKDIWLPLTFAALE